MDSLLSHYKDFSVSRGLKYHYYFSPADAGKPTLLLIHGFPSLSLDWHHQITYFKAKGYGLVAPDMLGYGDTDKPEDYKAYVHTLITRDLMDILDHEKVANVIAIGHDWYAVHRSQSPGAEGATLGEQRSPASLQTCILTASLASHFLRLATLLPIRPWTTTNFALQYVTLGLHVLVAYTERIHRSHRLSAMKALATGSSSQSRMPTRLSKPTSVRSPLF